jgi:Fic family protein
VSPKSSFEDISVPWQPDQAYNDLPILPPSVELETRAVLKKCVTARAALAELKQAAGLIPNPAMLINTLPILEARASSEIENIVTTADVLFQYMSHERAADPASKEALRYRRALLEGFRGLDRRPLSTGTAEEICTWIMGRPMSVRRVPGTALFNSKTGTVVYTPPDGEERIRRLLANWERFLHERTEVDPLVRIAAAHYQFEAIHPFTDGNGRTGRVLNSLALVELDLLPLPILYLSKFIIARKEAYYDRLLAVTTDGAWEPWVLYVLQGVEDTAAWTTEKIAAIRRLSEDTREFVKSRLPKIYSQELVDVLFEQPYCRIGNVVDAGVVERQAASRYLRTLAKAGILSERKAGREKLFVHTRLLDLLMSDRHAYAPLPVASTDM